MLINHISELSGLIQLVLIIIGIVVIYYKDKGTNEISNVSQDKDLVKLKEDCDKCKKDVDNRFSKFDTRMEKFEHKQSTEIKELYDKLDNVEQRILSKIDNLITEILFTNKKNTGKQ